MFHHLPVCGKVAWRSHFEGCYNQLFYPRQTYLPLGESNARLNYHMICCKNIPILDCIDDMVNLSKHLPKKGHP
jgi:hypothetical protein